MACELQAIVVGDRFDSIALQGTDDCCGGVLFGFSRKLLQQTRSALSLVEAE